MANEIFFTLNGKETVYTGRANARLLDVLREDYQLKGVKCGCNEGECGACSVIIDGRLANSCMLAMGRISGSTIVTIEGYRETKQFAMLNKAFASVSGVQCGYCIP